MSERSFSLKNLFESGYNTYRTSNGLKLFLEVGKGGMKIPFRKIEDTKISLNINVGCDQLHLIYKESI